MKRFLTSAVALAIAATSFPSVASARDWHHGYHHRGNAVAAGVVGLALGTVLGAAITSGNHRRYYDPRYSDGCYDRCGYDRGSYRDGYYEDGYDDGYGPSICIVRERRYDPYSGRALFIEERRPC